MSVLENTAPASGGDVLAATTSRPRTIEEDARALRADFHARGFDRPATARVLATWVATFVAHAGLVGLSLVVESTVLAYVATGLAGVLMVALGTQCHTASHNALTGNSRLDRLILLLSFTFSGMLSANYWMHSHVRVHHTAPNLVGHDTDADLRPFFFINEAHVASLGARWRWLVRFQIVWFLLLLPLNGITFQWQGLAYWMKELRAPQRPRGFVGDTLALLGHVLWRIALPLALHVPASRLFGVYFVWTVVASYGMFAILGPGHYPHAARVLAPSQRAAGSYWLRQTATTVNFRTGFIGRFLCAGLEHQIEHHLFPGYCHVHYEKMAPLVRAFCARNGLPYVRLGWGEALWETLRTFVTPKPLVHDVLTLHTPPNDARMDSAPDSEEALPTTLANAEIAGAE